MTACLRIETGPRTGERIPLFRRKVMFGRHLTCDCVLAHPTVSRQHFCVERVGDHFFLVDQDSNNGTFANGERVTWVELKNGDRVQAGPFLLTAELPVRQGADAVEPSEAEARAGFDETHEQAYPREYLEGIAHFNAGRYYEAHEVWEEIWLRSSDETKLFLQMLIQAAVGLHHYGRDNPRGCRGMHRAVTEKLARLPSFYMSLDLADFARQFEGFFAELMDGGDESLPPADKPPPLIHLAKADLSEAGLP